MELPKKIIEETLTDCAITALKCTRKIFPSRSSLNFEPSWSWARLQVGMPTSDSCLKKNIFFPNKHWLLSSFSFFLFLFSSFFPTSTCLPTVMDRSKALQEAVAVYEQLKKEFQSPKPNLSQCGQLLDKVKVRILLFLFLFISFRVIIVIIQGCLYIYI